MKKEYLQQFEELDEEFTKEDIETAMYYEKDAQDSLDSLNNI